VSGACARDPAAARRAVLGFRGASVSIAARAGPAPAPPSQPASFLVEGRSALTQPPRPAAAAPPVPQAPAPHQLAADAAAPELLASGCTLGAPRVSSSGGRAARLEAAERAERAPDDAAAAGEPSAAQAAEGAASAATPAASFYRQQTRCARAAPASRTRPTGTPSAVLQIHSGCPRLCMSCWQIIPALARGIPVW